MPAVIAGSRRAGNRWEESNRYDTLMQAALDNQHGFVLSLLPDDPFDPIAYPDKRIAVFVQELQERLRAVDPPREMAALALPPDYPFILQAGLHVPVNANTLQRNPAWNQGQRWSVVLISPQDAAELGIADGEKVELATATGRVQVEAEVSERARPSCLYLQHGFGLIYDGVRYGTNVNDLTSASHRDEMGTPLHRRVPCQVRKLSREGAV